jgi:hypothetical protein
MRALGTATADASRASHPDESRVGTKAWQRRWMRGEETARRPTVRQAASWSAGRRGRALGPQSVRKPVGPLSLGFQLADSVLMWSG